MIIRPTLRPALATLLVASLAACSGPAAAPVTTTPTTPAPTTTATTAPAAPTAADVVARGTLAGTATDDAGDVMSVWVWCRRGGGHCRHAWRITRTGGGSVTGGLGPGLAPSAYGAGHAFVVSRWNRRGEVVDPAGRSTPLAKVARGHLTAGDVVVNTRRDLAVVDADAAVQWPIPHPPGVDGWAQGTVSSTGTLWLLPHGAGPAPVVVRRTTDGEHWSSTVISADRSGGDVPGYVVTAGERIAVLATFDGATILPVGTIAVTTDDGAHWVRLGRSDLPFDTVGEMAATRGGTLFVTSAEGEQLYRSTDDTWTRFAPVRHGAWVAHLAPAAHGLLAYQGPARPWRPVAFDDLGQRSAAPDLR